MSETAKMFDDMLNDTESFFVPGEETKNEKPKFSPNVRGEFYGHMQEASTREVSWTRDVEVQVLPPLKADDIDGKPVIAVIDAGKPYKNKEGQSRTPYVVKFVKEWEGGVKKDAEIPF